MTQYHIPTKVQELGVDIREDQLKYHHCRVGVVKEFTFDAAHHLHAYEGKCVNLHGHTYRLIVKVSGYVNSIGILVDFNEMKKMIEEHIKSRLDHHYLNEILPPMNTTAENMIVWIWNEITNAMDGKDNQAIRLEEITLYETPTSYAYLTREWMEEAK